MGPSAFKNDKGIDVKLKSLNSLWDVFEVLSECEFLIFHFVAHL